MILNHEFNETTYRSNQQLFYDVAYAKINSQKKKSFITGIILLALGTAIVIGKDAIGYVFIAFGLLSLFAGYILNKNTKTAKKKVDRYVSDYVVAARGQLIYWEVNDNFIKYKDFKVDVTLQWSSVSAYEIIKNTLIIYTDIALTLIYSEDEMSTGQFAETISLLKSKVGDPKKR